MAQNEVLLWEENRVSRENPPLLPGDHIPSCLLTPGNQTRAALVRVLTSHPAGQHKPEKETLFMLNLLNGLVQF